jgi:TonB family protein
LKTEKPSAPSPTPKTEAPKQEEKVDAKKEVEILKSVKTEHEKAKAGKSEVKIQSDKDKDEAKTDKLNADQGDVAAVSAPKIEKPVGETQALAGPEKKTEESKVEAKEQAPVSIAMEPVQQVQHQAEDKDLRRASISPSTKAKKYTAKSEVATGGGLAGNTQINSKQISGKVTSAEDGSPLPGVNVLVEGTTQGTVTDSNGAFTLKTSNENKRLVFSFIGLQTQEVSVEEKDKVDVVLKQDVSQLSEVVVTGLGIQRDDNAEPVIHLASPVGGRKAYDKYLDANVRYPQQALENKIKGKVKIEFSVLTDGSLNDYKVVKGLGYGCDEEVIRLIREGPKWTPTTENGRPVESTVLVGVKFDPAKAGR